MSTSLITAVARTTGETRSTIRQLGFSQLLLRPPQRSLKTSLAVGLICPGCGDELPLLQQPGDELPEFAECSRCDAFYPYGHEELQVLEAVPLQPVREPLAIPA